MLIYTSYGTPTPRNPLTPHRRDPADVQYRAAIHYAPNQGQYADPARPMIPTYRNPPIACPGTVPADYDWFWMVEPRNYGGAWHPRPPPT